MRNIDLIKACTDLGVNKNGTELAPDIIVDNISLDKINNVYRVDKTNCEKEIEPENLRKNINYINQFDEELYDIVGICIENGNIPLTIGGDHSLAIATCLASKKRFNNIGLVWFDAHADFNTFETTITGNIHGLPFASITGQNGEELTTFFNGTYYNPENCVLIGARSIDYPGEMENLKKAGINIFTTEDIKKYGVKDVFDKAIKIVTKDTDGFHLSIDTDVMDPHVAPGVSVPENEGISEKEFYEMIDCFMRYKDSVKSIDLVEYNPKYDIDNKTLEIVANAVNLILYGYYTEEKASNTNKVLENLLARKMKKRASF